MNRSFTLFALLFCGATLTGAAQDDINGKLSISTQMFLKEQKGEISLDETETPAPRRAPGRHGEDLPLLSDKRHGRIIARPDTIDGRAYISAFIRLDDNKDVSALEALGVVVQCKFADGLVTANIPVERILDVARIGRVQRISVARHMLPLTDKAREATNADDALTNSYDARIAGLGTK